jgi:hypothetical protein
MFKTAFDYGFQQKYTPIGTKKLGCVMVGTTSPLVTSDVLHTEEFTQKQYFTQRNDRQWIKGITPAGRHHVTIRYGFLPDVSALDLHKVANDVHIPEKLSITGYEIFLSPYDDEDADYECVVALIDPTELNDANLQFGVLPNINTYPEFKPHVTIGYFYKGAWDSDLAAYYLTEHVNTLGWKISAAHDDFI